MRGAPVILIMFCALVACGRAGDGDSDGGNAPKPAPTAYPAPVPTPTVGGIAAPELGTAEPVSAKLVVVAAGADAFLDRPRDLQFHPDPARAQELFVVNAGYDGLVIIKNPGFPEATYDQRIEIVRADGQRPGSHFIGNPSSIAFGEATFEKSPDLTFATCQEKKGYMGPTLWSSSLEILAKLSPMELGSHLDMLHESPNCMGIVHVAKNVFWVVDERDYVDAAGTVTPMGSVTRYDFGHDHDVGMDDHGDGRIFQYLRGQVKRIAGIPSHLAYDARDGSLYVADTGNARIIKLQTLSEADELARSTEIPEAERQERKYGDASMPGMGQRPVYRRLEATLVEVVPAATGILKKPSGLELYKDRLFVSDNETGYVHAFALDGKLVATLKLSELPEAELQPGSLMGLGFGPDGKLYAVDAIGHRVLRVDP